MNDLDYKQIMDIIKNFPELNNDQINEFKKELLNYVEGISEVMAVLGIDIYHYSQYSYEEQCLIPLVFKLIYQETVEECLKYEKYIFRNYVAEKFNSKFIDTGDGGFQIFHTPFDALIFSIYFQFNIRKYNSNVFRNLEKFKKIIGEITLRYTLTYDKIYQYSGKFYGPSIINNARILSKDRLNRFLFDENTHEWFYNVFFGLENIQKLEYPNDFKSIKIFEDINTEIDINSKSDQSLLFYPDSRIINVDIQKIGTIKSKESQLSCFSLHLQAYLRSNAPTNRFNKFVVTLGNLNSTGLIENSVI